MRGLARFVFSSLVSSSTEWTEFKSNIISKWSLTMPDPSPAIKLKPVNVAFKGDVSQLQSEVIKGKILENALKEIQNTPNFNPAALSVVCGLKW